MTAASRRGSATRTGPTRRSPDHSSSAGRHDRPRLLQAATVNRGFDYAEELGRKADGSTLLDYLARRYPHSCRDEWAARIAADRVLVDGAPASSPGIRLRSGQSLVWRRPPWREPQAPLCFAILHRDPHLLAVAKPRGPPPPPAGGHLAPTLPAPLRRILPEASPLPRLDPGVSR